MTWVLACKWVVQGLIATAKALLMAASLSGFAATSLVFTASGEFIATAHLVEGEQSAQAVLSSRWEGINESSPHVTASLLVHLRWFTLPWPEKEPQLSILRSARTFPSVHGVHTMKRRMT
jgi:hypothetical protein